MSEILSELSLCTYSTGDNMVREVLSDWLTFLGERPSQVIFAVSPATGPPSIYEELRREGLIDQLIYLEPHGRSVREIDAQAIRLIVDAATTTWVLLVKLDTLPYRSGQHNWMTEAIRLIEEHKLFGMTGGFLIADLFPLENGYSLTQKFSNNFSIFRRRDWLNVIDAYMNEGHDSARDQKPQFQGDHVRFINEYAIERHLQEKGERMLVKHDSLDWSVFHVNVWGDALRKVRITYLQRKHVKCFFNTGKPFRRTLRYPWQKYYGSPRPPLLRLMRIVLGRWRRDLVRVMVERCLSARRGRTAVAIENANTEKSGPQDSSAALSPRESEQVNADAP